jgi:drug/metabolite transporter (DMT)-like permease
LGSVGACDRAGGGTEIETAAPARTVAPPAAGRLGVHASLLLTAILWGGNLVAIKYLLDGGGLGPLDVVFVRTGGASLFFLLAVGLVGRPWPRFRRADLARLVAVGLLGVTVLNLAVVFGQDRLPASLAGLIVTSNPVHTALISRLVTGEPLTRRKVAGIALAFLGLVVVVRFGAAGGAGFGGGEVLGVLILGIAPLSWAVYTVLSKPLLVRYPPVHVAASTTIAGSLGFLLIPVVRPGTLGRIGNLDREGWGAVLFATLLSFVVAYVLWYRGLRALPPSQAAVYIYLVPVFGLLAAWLILGEALTPALLLGGAVILSGVVLTNSARAGPKDRGHDGR